MGVIADKTGEEVNTGQPIDFLQVNVPVYEYLEQFCGMHPFPLKISGVIA